MSATEALDAYLERQQSSKKASSSARAAGKQQEPSRAATTPPARLSRASEGASKSKSMAKGPPSKAGAPRAEDRAREGAIKAVWPPSPLNEKDDRPLLAKAHPATARTAQRKPSETASKDQVSGLHHADHLQGPSAGHVMCNIGQLHQAACTYRVMQLRRLRPASETLAVRGKIASPCCEESGIILTKDVRNTGWRALEAKEAELFKAAQCLRSVSAGTARLGGCAAGPLCSGSGEAEKGPASSEAEPPAAGVTTQCLNHGSR